MGANATTTVPVYASGEVLTAADLNITNSGINVFSGTATRDAAFNGSGEKVLAEGQFAYLEDTNTTQYYDGAAWQSVGVAPGLVYITGASFTTATSVSLPTSTFSATYRNYRLFLQLTALSTDADFSMRFRSSGTDNTSSDYRTAGIGLTSVNASSNLFNNAATSFTMGESDSVTPWYYLVLDIVTPQVATYSYISGQTAFTAKSGASGLIGVNVLGNFNATTQFDSLTFISSVASSMTGAYRVYGYSES